MNAHGSIKVGDGTTYSEIKVGATLDHPIISGYRVWTKIRTTGVKSWIIAKEPDVRVKAFVPNSVLHEFDSPFAAIAALKRWSEAPPEPKKAKRVKVATAGSCRRNSKHPKPEKPDPTQLQFDLQDPRRKP
jgi:hypothetical protein